MASLRRAVVRREPERILVHRVGQLGDLVCAIPALAALREEFPRCWIGLLVSPIAREHADVVELFRDAAYVDDVIVYYRGELGGRGSILRWVNRLRVLRVDTFVELPPVAARAPRIARDLLFGKALGARKTVGWSAMDRIHGSAGKVTEGGEVGRLLDLLAKEGLLSPRRHRVRFPLPLRDSSNRASALVGSVERERVVALNPGAKRQTNRWPPERFAAVGRAITHRGMTVVLTGSPRERELCLRVRDLMGTDAVIAAGEGGVLFTAAVLQRCAALVTNDTGTMHLAAAVGTPAVVAGTARDVPGRWQPWGPGHRVIRKDVACSPCFREVCAHLTCLDQISVTEVLEALEEVLEAWRPGQDAEMSGTGTSERCL